MIEKLHKIHIVLGSQKIVDDPRCEIYNNVRCENGGLLEETENGFVCKCTDDYYGEYCTQGNMLKHI